MMGWKGAEAAGWGGVGGNGKGVTLCNHVSVTITYMSGHGILLPPICSSALPPLFSRSLPEEARHSHWDLGMCSRRERRFFSQCGCKVCCAGAPQLASKPELRLWVTPESNLSFSLRVTHTSSGLLPGMSCCYWTWGFNITPKLLEVHHSIKLLWCEKVIHWFVEILIHPGRRYASRWKL